MEEIFEKIVVVDPDKARKKTVSKTLLKKAEKIAKKYSATDLPIKPTCGHNTAAYKCSTLSSNDVFFFHKKFYSSVNKIDQDNFILQNVTITGIKRRRPRNDNKKDCRQFTVKYRIPSRKNKTFVPVCSKSFVNILRIKPSRAQGVIKRSFICGTIAKENRGGDRKTFSFASRKEAVQNFIKKFKPLEAHYSRGKIKQRIYLAPELNIIKMYRMYNDEALPGYEVKLGFFRKVFNTSFNIGFGSPRQDVCSTCLQLTESLKLTTNVAEKQKLRTEHRIHRLRAKTFFTLLKDENPEVQIISYDCQKNLPIPKIPDQATYYSRQIYLYNFTIVIGNSKTALTKDNVHAYIWTENQTSKDANAICSCVYNCLQNLNLGGKTILRLVADGCGGQNKNSMLIGMVMKWLHETKTSISEVQLIFPVTGHSFLPPDRVFALTEKQIRRRECIVLPKEYIDIISEHATVHNVTSDIEVLNWKSECKDFLKNTQSWSFQISKCKRIILRRGANKILVRGEISYRSDLSNPASLMKKGKKLSDFMPRPVPLGSQLKAAKLEDVDKLLQKHYGKEWQTIENLKFYKDIVTIVNSEGPGQNNGEDEDAINNSADYLLEEILDFV